MDLTELIEALGIKDDHWCGAYIPAEWAAIVIPLLMSLKEEGATVCQVKGKFGGLRVYVGGGASEAACNMVRLAEEKVWALKNVGSLIEAIKEARNDDDGEQSNALVDDPPAENSSSGEHSQGFVATLRFPDRKLWREFLGWYLDGGGEQQFAGLDEWLYSTKGWKDDGDEAWIEIEYAKEADDG